MTNPHAEHAVITAAELAQLRSDLTAAEADNTRLRQRFTEEATERDRLYSLCFDKDKQIAALQQQLAEARQRWEELLEFFLVYEYENDEETGRVGLIREMHDDTMYPTRDAAVAALKTYFCTFKEPA